MSNLGAFDAYIIDEQEKQQIRAFNEYVYSGGDMDFTEWQEHELWQDRQQEQ